MLMEFKFIHNSQPKAKSQSLVLLRDILVSHSYHYSFFVSS